MSPAPPIKVIAHELRTPLAGILGNLSLLEHPRYQDRQPELIRSLKRSAELMALTLANIALSEDTPHVQFEHISVSELFDDVDYLMRPLIEAKELTLITNTTKARVHGEYTLLRQALLNLLTNAVRATHEGRISLHEQGGTITITDTGTPNNHRGLGLGLPVTKKILEAHCSELHLTHTPNGTTARFTLEEVLPPAPETPADSCGPPQ